MRKKIFPAVLTALLALVLCPAAAMADDGGQEADGEEVAAAAEVTTAVAAADEAAVGVAADETDTIAPDTAGEASLPRALTSTDDIAGGTLGTCTWMIDSAGCLTIAPADGVSGSFEVDRNNSGVWPWSNYRDAILTAKVDAGVHAIGTVAYMFYGCSSLISLDLTGLDMSNTTSMWYMFSKCSSLSSIDIAFLDTSNVESMAGLFNECSSLKSVNFGSLDTSNVTDTFAMFSGCSALTSLDLSEFDTSNIERMQDMFSNCPSLVRIDGLKNWNTSSATNMGAMFYGCSSLASLDLSSFDTSKVTEMLSMFAGCSKVTHLDLSRFDTSNVERMTTEFSGCTSLVNLNLSGWNTSSTEDMNGMFRGCSSLVYLDMTGFDFASMYDAADMFDSCASLRAVAIGVNFDFEESFPREKGDLSDVRNNYLPVPVRDGVEGKWRSSRGGTIYDEPSQIPSNVSATYTAVFPAPGGGWKPVFGDVFEKTPANGWYYDAVYFMAELGVMNGYDETDLFGVGDTMTRADFVTAMWRYCEPDQYAAYVASEAKNTSGLPDVPDGQYYTGAVDWAVGAGIVTGNRLADGTCTFAPADDVSFEQMIAIAARFALGGEQAATAYDTSALDRGAFTDAGAVSDYARGPVAWAIDNGIVTGYDNGDGTYTIAPSESVLRERVATVLARSIQAGAVTAR